MLPYIYIGQLKISLYYTAMILGYVMMVVFMLLKSRRTKYGLNPLQSVIFATAELIFGVLGCKILFILEDIPNVIENGLSFGGFSFYGSVLLIPLLMPLIGKLLHLNWRDTLDNSAICILAMLSTIRIGCFLAGCCGGITLVAGGDFYFKVPTQLMECACSTIILILLLKWEKRGVANGFFYPTLLITYGCARFLIEFLRDTAKDWLHLSHGQWFSIAAIIAGVTFEILLRKQTKKMAKKQKAHRAKR